MNKLIAITALLFMLVLSAHVGTGFIYPLIGSRPEILVEFDHFVQVNFFNQFGRVLTMSGMFLFSFGAGYTLIARAERDS